MSPPLSGTHVLFPGRPCGTSDGKRGNVVALLRALWFFPASRHSWIGPYSSLTARRRAISNNQPGVSSLIWYLDLKQSKETGY